MAGSTRNIDQARLRLAHTCMLLVPHVHVYVTARSITQSTDGGQLGDGVYVKDNSHFISFFCPIE